MNRNFKFTYLNFNYNFVHFLLFSFQLFFESNKFIQRINLEIYYQIIHYFRKKSQISYVYMCVKKKIIQETKNVKCINEVMLTKLKTSRGNLLSCNFVYVHQMVKLMKTKIFLVEPMNTLSCECERKSEMKTKKMCFKNRKHFKKLVLFRKQKDCPIYEIAVNVKILLLFKQRSFYQEIR